MRSSPPRSAGTPPPRAAVLRLYRLARRVVRRAPNARAITAELGRIADMLEAHTAATLAAQLPGAVIVPSGRRRAIVAQLREALDVLRAVYRQDIHQDIRQDVSVIRDLARWVESAIYAAALEYQREMSQASGAERYVWISSRDSIVRPRHRELHGTIQRWDDPPIADASPHSEYRYHPGERNNCRCLALTVAE